jgi:hypothetical protein
MFYIISFVIIIVFVIETWNSIKVNTYYKEQFQNSRTNATTNSNNNIKQLLKHGFLPANIGENSNFILYPKSTNIEELIEKDKSGNYKYAYSHPSSMFYNEDYFNPEIKKYNKNRNKLPKDWMCQRKWFDCNQSEDYFNKFKKFN